MFQKNTFTEINAQTFGAILINKNTLNEVRKCLQQTMINNQSHIDGIRASIFAEGYKQVQPIVFGENNKIIDGWTRLSACVKLVEELMVDEFIIPFMTSDLEPEAFNTASRGSTAKDISDLFTLPKHLNIGAGKSLRAAKEAIEASEMLDVDKLGYSIAFSPDRTQEHVSKIVRNSVRFKQAFLATCEVLKSKNIKPDDCKFAHILAIFVRYEISTATKKVVSKYIVSNTGSTQKSRLSAFDKCAKEIKSISGL